MGAFCVFGISRQVCRKQAEKTVPTWCSTLNRSLSAPEWGNRVSLEANRLFLESSKVVRISPELDAPQFCYDWIAAGPSEVRLTAIMVRGPKMGDDGKPVLRKGAPVMVWQPYDGRGTTPAAPVKSKRKAPAPA